MAGRPREVRAIREDSPRWEQINRSEFAHEQEGLRELVDSVHAEALPFPEVTEAALRQLKFQEILPAELAADTVARRLADPDAARQVLAGPIRWTKPN